VRYIDALVLRDEDKDSNDDCTESGTDERLYYLNDANMNVTALVNTSGTVVERYVYDPYGAVKVYSDDWSTVVTTWAASKKNNIRYCGYFFDDESGLYNPRHRYYHPTLGRWTSRDPVEYSDSMGLYEYVRALPVRGRDPWGKGLLVDVNTPAPFQIPPPLDATSPAFPFDNDQPDRNIPGDFVDPKTSDGKTGASFATRDYCCLCVKRAQELKKWDEKMAAEVAKARSDPSAVTGADVAAILKRSLASQGIEAEEVGSTSPTGVITVKPSSEPCGALIDGDGTVHELSHKKDQEVLLDQVGKDAYRYQRSRARDWANSDIKAYRTGALFIQSFLDACKSRFKIVP